MKRVISSMRYTILTLSLLLSAPLSFAAHPFARVSLNAKDSTLQQKTGLDERALSVIIPYLEQLEDLHVSAWSSNYPLIRDLIKQNNLLVGCELGVAFGTHSAYILGNTEVSKLYSIDPYRHFPNSVYPDGMNLEQQAFDVLYEKVQRRLSAFGDRTSILRMTSGDAAQLFVNDSLDFVYIDANHTYLGVWQDLNTWINKVRPGGLLIGDDYDHPAHPGVKKAVDQFFAQRNIKLNISDRTWWIIKS